MSTSQVCHVSVCACCEFMEDYDKGNYKKGKVKCNHKKVAWDGARG